MAPRPPQPNAAPPRGDGLRINGEINARNVRLIDQDNQMIGVVSLREALIAAEDAELDLVEISPQIDPPVCKILDYGKYLYELQKKKREARKNQKIVELKEIKLRPMIDDHDYDVKMRSVEKFIAEGDKVKITLRFRGRELSHQDIGMQVLDRVRAQTEPYARIEALPKLEGKQMIMILAPLK